MVTIAWLPEDEIRNLNEFGVSFEMARQVVRNPNSFTLPNIAGDYIFIGTTDDLTNLLAVYCVRQEKIRQILFARRASPVEQKAYFQKLQGIL